MLFHDLVDPLLVADDGMIHGSVFAVMHNAACENRDDDLVHLFSSNLGAPGSTLEMSQAVCETVYRDSLRADRKTDSTCNNDVSRFVERRCSTGCVVSTDRHERFPLRPKFALKQNACGLRSYLLSELFGLLLRLHLYYCDS
jgi:hypothetical protein